MAWDNEVALFLAHASLKKNYWQSQCDRALEDAVM